MRRVCDNCVCVRLRALVVSVVARAPCGPPWIGCAQPCCGWRTRRNSAACSRAWAKRTLHKIDKKLSGVQKHKKKQKKAKTSLNKFTFIGAGLVDVSNGGRLDYVADDEFFNGFVLRNAAAAVGAVDVDDMAATVLGASTISSLLGLLACQKIKTNKHKKNKYAKSDGCK